MPWSSRVCPGFGRCPSPFPTEWLRFPGRLRGHLADDRDLFDMFEFQRAAADLLGAEVTVYSDGALRNQHVSPDLVAATPL